ncbi:MAG: thioredoxin family protein [Campylobacterales bacterium]|nr:thioredoxin family protein [Campylobacterales bacterium]
MKSLEEILDILKKQSAVAIYFGGKNCGVCKVLQPKIKDLLDQKFPKIEQIYLDAQAYNNVAIHFGVFSIPTLLVFLDGKEFFRKSRNISLGIFEQELARPYEMFFGEE